MSNKFTDAAINAFLSGYTNVWVSLHYDDPGLGTYNNYEVVGGSYMRKQATFSAPSNRTIWLENPVAFYGLPATSLTHIGIWTDQYNGTLVAVAEIPNAPVSITSGGSYTIADSAIALGID